MSLADKAKHKAEELIGKAKEAAGKSTDDRYLEHEGKTDQTKANIKDAGEKAKDAFRH
ncbi:MULTISPECIES: CsbD family protein [Nocardia]|uniref:CsbD family protein n=1 Tax=Nocardia coubleae TaxID=356147 RepID=A0A846W181_9NOCA|nr:CsbD family protein [Nocardia coubleae]NKX86775.1 CsbD family protein [Nocardia coubleae]